MMVANERLSGRCAEEATRRAVERLALETAEPLVDADEGAHDLADDLRRPGTIGRSEVRLVSITERSATATCSGAATTSACV